MSMSILMPVMFGATRVGLWFMLPPGLVYGLVEPTILARLIM